MEWKAFFTDEQWTRLTANWKEQQPLKGTRHERDFIPVTKLFDPFGAATWLLTECDEDGLCFALCDMGFGCPEMGYVSLDELASLKVGPALRIEADLFFMPTKTLSQYAEEARQLGRINA